MQYNDAATFLRFTMDHPVFDVRSPSEFRQGHIPGAISLPLFDDEERRKVGILYKNSGRDASVLIGLDLVGPKMSGFIKQVRKVVHGSEILMHCWRGGMRSSGMGWLMEMAGYDVRILKGGYKTYRSYIRQNIGEGFQFVVIGGKTGSGKTEILHLLEKQGEQVLGLEKIAHHKGSAFGHIGQEVQPTNEQFENDLFANLHQLNPDKPVWMEDESRSIGTVSLSDPFIRQMKTSPLIFIDVDKAQRIERLVKEYSNFNAEMLNSAVHRIAQRLGGLNAGHIIDAIGNNDLKRACDMLLVYYDRQYLAGLKSRPPEQIYTIVLDSNDPEYNAGVVLQLYKQNFDTLMNHYQFDNLTDLTNSTNLTIKK
jgi:tRNA 2-selenouridine synthase